MTIQGGDYLKGGLYTRGEGIIYKGVLYMGVYGSLLRSMKMYYIFHIDSNIFQFYEGWWQW